MTLHDEVEAVYYFQERDGRRLLQISTFGRATRQEVGKVSQTFQLDEIAARELYGILKDRFGF
jgi:hypothetical protein